jgi:hypothetical protein
MDPGEGGRGSFIERKRVDMVKVKIKSRKEPIYEEKVCQGVDRGKRPEKSSNAQE